MTQQNSSHSLDETQWEQVKEWVLERKSQKELRAMILETFGVTISQPAISNSRHYKAAKKELTAMVAEESREALEANQPRVVKTMVDRIEDLGDEIALLSGLKKELDPQSREYAELSNQCEKLDKQLQGWTDRYNTLADIVSGLAVSPVQAEEQKRDFKVTLQEMRAQREQAANKDISNN